MGRLQEVLPFIRPIFHKLFLIFEALLKVKIKAHPDRTYLVLLK